MNQTKTMRLTVGWLVLFAALASTLAAVSAYHVIKRIPIPGDYGWDYVTADSEGRRLYVPHGVEVVVLDLDSGAIVGKISVGKTRMASQSRGNLDAALSAPPIRVLSRSSISKHLP